MGRKKLSIEGKIVFITGASAGIGAATALAFAEEGAKLLLAARRISKLKQTAEEALESGAKAVHCLELDVRDRRAVQNAVDALPEEWAHIDVLVNNAGIMDHFDPVGDLDKALWDKVIAVNLTGPFIMTKIAIQHLLGRNSKGVILNIGSLASFRGGTAGVFYEALDT